jgi:sigma-54 dependent transcriptional regulator, acetoin dehydrogenase operon transcriptional activator AcoR
MNNILLTKKTWERFVKEGVLDTTRISKRIMESWYRSKELNVDPFLEKGKNILTYEEYEKKVADNHNLLKISMPYLETLWRSIQDKGVYLILTDSKGYILKVLSKSGVKEFLNQFNIVQGVKWTEDEVGTNAIGTTLVTHEPILVVGREHFSVASHGMTCSAAPIKNSRGELIGVLDISNINLAKNLNILSLVVSVAYAIESQWKLQEQMRRIALIEHFMKMEKNPEEKVLISDIDGYFVTASDSIMQITRENTDLYHSNIESFQDMGIEFNKKQPIYTRENLLLGYRHEVKNSNDSIKGFFAFPSTFNFLGEQGISMEFHKVINEIEIASRSDITVSIYGESGTGKEVVAKSIHLNSIRKNKPFVAVNCGAIPKELLESELFGYVEGAFTGALKKGYVGKFAQANGGTIFLDEIGEMSFSMQVALLRVIQEKEVIPIGGSKAIPIDVRIITATNKNLEELVRQGGKFREDLYYRLHVFDIKLPPLRKRKKDIPYLIKFFFEKKNLHIDISSSIIDCLTEYAWPGNIRELFNVLEKMIVLANGNSLMLTHVPSYIRENQKNRNNAIQTNLLQEGHFSNKDSRQRTQIMKALQDRNGNVRDAADLIGMPLSTFYRKLKKFNL